MSGSDPPRPNPSHLAATTIAPDTTQYGIELPRRSSARVASLVVIAGAAADVGTHLLVGDEVVIGRVGAGLVLRDGRISRNHARVWRDGERWLVEDLASTNGASLNGRVLERPTPLGDGDKVYLGSTVLKFTLVDETEAAYLEQMARLAGTDPLTGLHAKHRWDGMLEEALRATRLADQALVVLMMDMDGLKRINDTYGHRSGANTIAGVGGIIGRVLDGLGAACRFGGDEFCAYVVGAEAVGATELAERIRAEVERATFTVDGFEVRATISIGIASRESDSTPPSLVAAADRALYVAKREGRNRVSR